jgi:hypothetical protein
MCYTKSVVRVAQEKFSAITPFLVRTTVRDLECLCGLFWVRLAELSL